MKLKSRKLLGAGIREIYIPRIFVRIRWPSKLNMAWLRIHILTDYLYMVCYFACMAMQYSPLFSMLHPENPSNHRQNQTH